MVDLVFDSVEGGFDVGEIEHPAKYGIDRTANVNPNVKTVAVQPVTFVFRGNVGQPVRRLDRKLLEDFH